MLADATTMMAADAATPTERLIEAAKEYSNAAWAAIYDEHYQKMYRYCLLRCGDTTTAEDLAADVFVAALRGIHRYEYRGVPLSAWLYSIARNLTADHLRKQTNRPSVPLTEVEGHQALQEPDIAPAAADRNDILEALRRLKDDHQQVLILRFFQDLSHDETAAIMGRRPGAVRVLQSRALTALRQVMAA